MSIPTIEGDLLDFPQNLRVIAQGCNTLNLMGSGLAKQIVVRYPEAKIADDLAHKNGLAVLGMYSAAALDSLPGHWIINLYQQSQLRQLNMFALEKALNNALEFVQGLDDGDHDDPLAIPRTMGIPYKLGCGLAKGNWTEVLSLLSRVDKQHPARLLIVRRPQDH
jgi:hypothetical protein